MYLQPRTAALPGVLFVCVALCAACHEDPPGAYGTWDDAPDGGVTSDGGPSDDGGTPPDDMMQLPLVCTPPFVGGEEGGYDFTSRWQSTPSPHGRLPDDDDDKYIIPDPRCYSGWRWIGDDEDSDLMTPGRDCMSCHPTVHIDDDEDDDDEAPGLSIAGTVYAVAGEPDDCLGASGARIRITDAMGKLFELTSNRAGNFFREAKRGIVQLPFSAELVYQGRTRKMKTQQCNTSCNACHTAKGMNGAPGRILLP